MKKIVLFFILLFIPNFVLAQGQGDVANYSASGTLVASALETVGYHAQGQILSSLSEDLTGLAALIYIGVIFSAVLTTALIGQYRMAIWLLIGPPLFIYASGIEVGKNGDTAGQKNRISSSGAEWRFGAFKDPGGYRDELVRSRIPNAEVSFVFHKYNQIVSEIYQFIINAVTSEDISKQMLFMSRQRVMEELFGSEQAKTGLTSVGQFLAVDCSSELTYARLVAQGLRDKKYRETSDYKDAEIKYCDLFPRKSKKIDSDGMKKYLLSLPSMKAEQAVILEAPVSCMQVWNWYMEGAISEVKSQLESNFVKSISPEAFQTMGAGIAERIKTDIVSKLQYSVAATGGEGKDPCPTISTGGAIASGDILTNMFSALLVRKGLSTTPDQTGYERQVAGSYSGITPFEKEAGAKMISPMANEDTLRRQKAQEFATGRKYEAFNLLMLMPYFQGILLYALSVMYPFFCFLILVPGQAQGFFTWLALWAWVKSWDVGWACIMLIDQLLWEILPKSTFFNLSNTSQTTPATLLEMHFGGDYAYSMTSYWLLLSGMISLVPIITAEAILGSKKSIANFVMGGISDIANRLSTSAESFVSTMNATSEIARREGQDGFRNANSMLAMQGDMKGMFSKLDQALGPTQSERQLQGAMGHATGVLGAFGLGGGGGSGVESGEAGSFGGGRDAGREAGTAARIDSDTSKAANQATEDSKAPGGTPITSNPAMKQIARDAISRSGGVDYASMGITDPKMIGQFNEYLETAMIERIFAHNLAERQDVRGAVAATAAFIGSGRKTFSLAAAARSAADAIVDARKDSASLLRHSSSMQSSFMSMLDGQMRWERASSPAYFESEQIRAYLTQNRNEWFFNPDPLSNIYQDVSQGVYESDNAMRYYEGRASGKDDRYQADWAYQIIGWHFGAK